MEDDVVRRRLTGILTVMAGWLLACGCFDFDGGGCDFSLGGGCAYSPTFQSEAPEFTPSVDGMGEGGLVFALLDPLVTTSGGSCVETLRAATLERIDVRCLASRATAIGASMTGEVYVLDQGGTRVSTLSGSEIVSGIAGGRAISFSALGRYAAVVASHELLALVYPYPGYAPQITVLALDSAEQGRNVAEMPLVTVLDAPAAEGGFYVTTQSTGASVAWLSVSAGPTLSARVRLSNASCSETFTTGVRAGSLEAAVWDDACDALYRVEGSVQDTSATLRLAAAGPEDSLEWSYATGEFFTPSLGAEVIADFGGGTIGTAGILGAPTAQVGGYSGARLWIAQMPVDSSSSATLATFDPVTRTMGPVYAFEPPGLAVRDLAYVDRPPQMGLAGSPSAVHAGVPSTIGLIATDPDGDVLTAFEMTEGPSGATFSATNGQGVFQWTPTCAQSGLANARFAAAAGGWTAYGLLEMHVVACDDEE